MFKATVSLVRCETYAREDVRGAVERALALAPGAEDLFRPGVKVLLKPNLLSSSDPPERAVNTHPEFVRAVAEYCRDRGCAVLIGDSCGSLAPGSTARAMEVTGLREVAEETGAELVDIDHTAAMEAPIPDGRVLRSISVSRIVREVDLVVTLPKLKTHGLTLLTGAVKNQFGLVPGRRKKDTHVAAPKPAAMAQALVDIYSVARPHLAIMDGIVGMEGNGPAAGEPREVGLVLASLDCVALDAVVAEIMGYRRGEVFTTRYAHERNLGCGDISEIRIAGVSLSEARIREFKTPPHRMQGIVWALAPSAVVRWLINQVGSAYPTILEDRCVLCGECVKNCPVQAMRMVEGKLRCDHGVCIGCYCCSEVCRQRAIRMRKPLAGRIMHSLVGKKESA